MYIETVREIREDERRVLRERLDWPCPVSLPSTVKWLAIWVGSVASLAGIAVWLATIDETLAWIAVGVLFFAGIACLYAVITLVSSHRHWRVVYRRFLKDTVPLIEKVLNDGMVQSKRVIASAVIEIGEVEDEGEGYLFDIGDGRSVLLKGQRYSPALDGSPWPSDTFEIVRSVTGDLWIGLFSSGRELSPDRVVPMTDCSQDFVWSEAEEVIEKQPEAVLRDITTIV